MNEMTESKFIEACKTGNMKLLEEELNKGIDINGYDEMGRTGLHWAVLNRDISMLERLVKVDGIELNPVADLGRTPLHWCLDEQCLKLAVFLLQFGANPWLVDEFGLTYMDRVEYHKLIPEMEKVIENMKIKDILGELITKDWTVVKHFVGEVPSFLKAIAIIVSGGVAANFFSEREVE
jgi:ankyrin repeat protein